MPGYSGTPLAKKLGYAPDTEVHVASGPDDYRRLVAPLPDGVRFVSRPSKRTAMVHLFATRQAVLAKSLASLRKRLAPDAAVWVSWPKKSANVPTDITEDSIRAAALPLGWVDVKVCAVTDVWSGLKLVVRKELR